MPTEHAVCTHAHAQPSANVPATTGTYGPEGERFFVGAAAGDVERVHRDGNETDRLTNWTVDTNYGEHRAPPAPLGGAAAAMAAGQGGGGGGCAAPVNSSMQRGVGVGGYEPSTVRTCTTTTSSCRSVTMG